MSNQETETKPADGRSDSNAGLATPVVFLDEDGRIVIVGFGAWNKASFVDADRAFPDSWTRLIPVTANVKVRGCALLRSPT
jgi:hypothetical protein